MIELLAILRTATLASSAALLLVLLLRKPMRQCFRPHVAYAIWVFVPTVLVAALLPAPVKIVSVQTIPAALAADKQQTIVPTSFVRMQLAPTFDPASWLVGVWLTGVGLTLLMFLRQQRSFVRNLGYLSRITGTILRAQTVVGSPALVGVLSPRIVVPVDFEQRYSDGEQRLILAHECYHQARGDALFNAFCMLLRCVFWFNPLIHIAAVYFRLDQELTCDAAVIARFGGARRSYARAMLKTQLAPAGLPMGCYWSPGNALKERILLLKEPMAGPIRGGLSAAIAMVLIGAGTYAAWAMQPPRILLRYTTVSAKLISDKVVLAAATRAQVGHYHSTNGLVQKDVSTLTRSARDSALPSNAAHTTIKAIATIADQKRADFRQSDTTLQAIESASNALPSQSRRQNEDVDVAAVNRAPVENPSYRETNPPPYPPQAIRERIEGSIVLKVHVDEHGKPTGAEIASLKPSAATILADSSIAAVMQWRFNPALRDGRPVAGTAVVPLSFLIPGFPKDTSSTGEIVYAESTQMRRASYRRVRQIEYPPEQALASIQGVVHIKVRVAADGSVSSASVDRVEPSSAQALADAAVNGAKTWTFNPAHVAGKDIASSVTVPVVFALHSGARLAGMDWNASNALDPILVLPNG